MSSAFKRALKRIDDPAVQKIVIMAKRERGELSATETERLIRDLGLVNV